MGLLLKPIVNSILLNTVNVTSDLLPYLQGFSITKFLSGQANLLDATFTLPPSLSLTVTPQIYNDIQITFSYDSINLANTGVCTIDRSDIKIFDNSIYVGAQGYDYFSGLINSQGNQSNSDDITAFIKLTKNITVGGEVGNDSGEYTLLEMLNIIATNLKADLIVNGYVNFGVAGWGDSRSINKGVDGDTYGEILEKLAQAYGYLFQIKPPINPAKKFTIVFTRYSYLVSSSSTNIISKNNITSQSKFEYDYSKAVKYFIIKYPYWDFSGTFGTKTSYKMILYGIDTRVNSANNTATYDMRNEGFLFGYVFPDNTTAPVPLPQYVANNALERLYGAIWENNQKTFLADINVIGNPNIEPGIVVQLTDFNATINGNWLVTEVKHEFKNSGWLTNFKCFKIFNFTIGFTPSFNIYLEQMLYSTFDSLYG